MIGWTNYWLVVPSPKYWWLWIIIANKWKHSKQFYYVALLLIYTYSHIISDLWQLGHIKSSNYWLTCPLSPMIKRWTSPSTSIKSPFSIIFPHFSMAKTTCFSWFLTKIIPFRLGNSPGYPRPPWVPAAWPALPDAPTTPSSRSHCAAWEADGRRYRALAWCNLEKRRYLWFMMGNIYGYEDHNDYDSMVNEYQRG